MIYLKVGSPNTPYNVKNSVHVQIYKKLIEFTMILELEIEKNENITLKRTTHLFCLTYI